MLALYTTGAKSMGAAEWRAFLDKLKGDIVAIEVAQLHRRYVESFTVIRCC